MTPSKVLNFTKNDDGTVSVERWEYEILVDIAMLQQVDSALIEYDGEYINFTTRNEIGRYRVCGPDLLNRGVVKARLSEVVMP